MHHLYHFFGAHKSFWRFRLIVATVNTILVTILVLGILISFSSIKGNVSVPGYRALCALLLIFVSGFVSYHLFIYISNSSAKPLSDNTLKQLSPRILSHYKSQIESFSFHNPISWGDLYILLRHLKVADENERNETISQETLLKQKSCIQDLVK